MDQPIEAASGRALAAPWEVCIARSPSASAPGRPELFIVFLPLLAMQIVLDGRYGRRCRQLTVRSPGDR